MQRMKFKLKHSYSQLYMNSSICHFIQYPHSCMIIISITIIKINIKNNANVIINCLNVFLISLCLLCKILHINLNEIFRLIFSSNCKGELWSLVICNLHHLMKKSLFEFLWVWMIFVATLFLWKQLYFLKNLILDEIVIDDEHETSLIKRTKIKVIVQNHTLTLIFQNWETLNIISSCLVPKS